MKIYTSQLFVDQKQIGKWEMDHVSLKRVIICPYCGASNRMDFTDECELFSEERQMGPEITYSFDIEDCECISCGKQFCVSGYICEYPVGAYNYEDIKVEKAYGV